MTIKWPLSCASYLWIYDVGALGPLWFRWWLFTWWYQVITWIKVGLPANRSKNFCGMVAVLIIKYEHKTIGLINNIQTFVKTNALTLNIRRSNMPLSEPMVAWFTDAYERHSALRNLHTNLNQNSLHNSATIYILAYALGPMTLFCITAYSMRQGCLKLGWIPKVRLVEMQWNLCNKDSSLTSLWKA